MPGKQEKKDRIIYGTSFSVWIKEVASQDHVVSKLIVQESLE